MRGLNKLPKEYFLKYKEKPVKIKSYNSIQTDIAQQYIERLKNLLLKYQIRFSIRGSTAFKIPGKGEVEVGVYPRSKDWKGILSILAKNFGAPENLEGNYARFNDICENVEVEIIVLKGHDADVDIKLHEFLISRPDILNEYVKLKKKYCYSKREYMKQKNSFFSKITEQL